VIPNAGLVLGLVLGLGAGTPAVDRQDPLEIATRASRTYRALRAISADFVQTIEDRMLGPQEASGHLIQAGASKLAMRFTDPKGEAVIIDGTYVWLYTPSTTPGQVIRTDVPHDPVYGPNVLARILDRPEERYRIRYLGVERAEDQPVYVLAFEPLTEDPLFRRAILWIGQRDALPYRLELDELTGVRRILTLSRVRVNERLPADAFTFRVPQGVRVVVR